MLVLAQQQGLMGDGKVDELLVSASLQVRGALALRDGFAIASCAANLTSLTCAVRSLQVGVRVSPRTDVLWIRTFDSTHQKKFC